MHEMSLCIGMIDIVRDQALREGASRVTAVRLEVGALAAVDAESLRFCFDAVTRGTLAEGARLEIDTPAGRGWCLGCDSAVAVARRFDPCPTCGSHRIQVTGGDEMRIIELEVE
jgi:hydrogenase nickel incorporation protein HypA/HybF